MELRDYIRMLRRGWPTIVLLTALFLGLTAGYLAISPKQYQATATLFVTTNDDSTIGALQSGSQFSATAVSTYSDIIDSAVVLGPVADSLRPQADLDELLDMVTTAPRTQTALIDIAVTGDDPDRVAEIANATAQEASQTLPGLGQPRGADASALKIVQIQGAVVPDAALSPDTQRTIAVGLIIGICVGLAVTIAVQALDTRLRRTEDVARVTQSRVLAALPHLRRYQRRAVVVRDEPTGSVGEAYRSLRTNLSAVEAAQHRSLLFAAVADDRDGAQVPVNLAWSIAQTGRTVLLVDLDLRQSSVGSVLDIPAGLGLADVLAGDALIGDVIHPTEHDQLGVVLSGTSQPSPSDLLSSPAVAELLRAFERQWDYVILHAPALLTFTDAAVVSRVAGSTAVTVAAGRTRAQDLSTALATLANVGVDPVGLILAGARGSSRENRRLRGPWSRLRSQQPSREDWTWSTDASAPRRSTE